MRNIVEIVLHHADAAPSRPAYRFFQGSSLVPETLTYGDVRQLACAFAARLQAEGLAATFVPF